MEVNLLFSIDNTYVDPLITTLYSIASNHSKVKFKVYLLYKESLERLEELQNFCHHYQLDLIPIKIEEQMVFNDAPVSKRYPETIYYRLLAHEWLPKSVTKILYLDADILCINDLTELYQLEIDDYLCAAASHTKLTNMTNVINKVRLKNYEAESYYNSGVLLMNVEKMRKEIAPKEIFNFIDANSLTLFLPDQDILNGLYGDKIKSIPDYLYNYDVRKNLTYEMMSNGEWTIDYVIKQTVFLHFCGKEKPWEPDYKERFASLYKHYYHRVVNKYKA